MGAASYGSGKAPTRERVDSVRAIGHPPPVPKIPARVAGVVAGLALAAHAFRAIPAFCATHFPAEHSELGGLLLVPPLVAALLGRLVLSFLPPGAPGPGGWREAATTWGTSFALGTLVVTPLQRLHAQGLELLIGTILLALLRWRTLPGKLVPRHPVPREPWTTVDSLAALAVLGWGVALLSSSATWSALAWAAAAAMVLHALTITRRARVGRWLVLGFLLLPGEPTGYDLRDSYAVVLGPTLSTTMGIAFALPWIRRADRRAGVLSAVGFASLLLEGFDPLVLVGTAVVCLAVHARQRKLTLVATAIGALWFLLPRWLTTATATAPRGRPIDWGILQDTAWVPETWGLAWPSLLLVPLLALRARGGPWSPGTIEEPRRETWVTAALVAATFLLELRGGSPWFEGQALVRLFPAVMLLAGLLAIPGQCAPAYARVAGTEISSSSSGE
jgi:hypothetical protein